MSAPWIQQDDSLFVTIPGAATEHPTAHSYVLSSNQNSEDLLSSQFSNMSSCTVDLPE